MEFITTFLIHPFFLGLALGLGLFMLSLWAHFKTKREFRRYQKHLSDKMEIEAAGYKNLKKDLEGFQKQNENLRLQVAHMVEKPEQKIGRELEILARAEKRMMVSAPGFAAAWEMAKQGAMEEIVGEEQGKSLPKRIFRKFFGAGATQSGEMIDALPDHSNLENEISPEEVHDVTASATTSTGES